VLCQHKGANPAPSEYNLLAHAAHATATFAELGMAISLGLMMKIIKPISTAPLDTIQIETRKREREKRRNCTTKDIEKDEGAFVALLHKTGCQINDAGNSISNAAHIFWLHLWEIAHYIALLFAIAALLGLAYCPTEETWTLGFAVISFLLAAWKGVHVHKSTKDGKSEGLLGIPLEPVQPENSD